MSNKLRLGAIARNDMIWRSLMAPNSKNDDDYQFARAKSTWKPNFAQIGGFLYFGDHFGFKMAAIANQDGRHMVQHVLLPVNIHFLWNLFIFKFLYWRTFWKFKKLSAQLWVMIYFCVKFQKDPLYTFRETCRTNLMQKKKVE